MRLPFQRCACGALLLFVTATGAVYHHDEETHTDRPSVPVGQFKVSIVASSSSSAVQGSAVNGVWYIST